MTGNMVAELTNLKENTKYYYYVETKITIICLSKIIVALLLQISHMIKRWNLVDPLSLYFHVSFTFFSGGYTANSNLVNATSLT